MNTAICLDRDGVLQALHDVIDPELGYNIVDLGLIYELQVDGGVVEITMTMTTPGCPAQDYILSGVYERCKSLPGVNDAKIHLTFLPAWSPRLMTPVAKAHFGIHE
jgi:metal-sulfur cluster biosynthetic enzyme